MSHEPNAIDTPSPATEPAPVSVPDFRSQLSSMPPEIRDNPNISRHESLEAVLKDHINAQSLLGRQGIKPPNREDLGDVNRFLKELGRPDSSDGYAMPEGYDPNDLGADESMTMKINELLHGAALTQEQYDKIMPGYSQLIRGLADQTYANSNADAESKIDAMKQEYGMAYDSKINAGERALSAVYGDFAPELMQLKLADGGLLGNNEGFVRGLIRLGETQYVDDQLIDSKGVRVSGPMDVESAKAEIDKLMADTDFRDRYFDNSNPGHSEANNMMGKLYEQAYVSKDSRDGGMR